MAEKTLITSNFYKQIAFLGTIVVTTLGGVKYTLNEFKEVVHAEMQPLADRVEVLEKELIEHDNLLAVNTPNIQAITVCVNYFLEYYNKTYHKEFLRPSDISITSEKRRK